MILAWYSYRYLMTAYCKYEGSVDEIGLVSGHAYTLLGVYQIMHSGKTITLVRLRCQWGN